MPHLLKNTILVLISIGLLWSFQTAVGSNFLEKKSELFDTSFGEESDEKENCEIKDWKLFNHAELALKISKLFQKLDSSDENIPHQTIASVPTSPPNV